MSFNVAIFQCVYDIRVGWNGFRWLCTVVFSTRSNSGRSEFHGHHGRQCNCLRPERIHRLGKNIGLGDWDSDADQCPEVPPPTTLCSDGVTSITARGRRQFGR